MSTDLFHQPSIQAIRDALTEKQQTIAVAESVTSGFLQAAFSAADGAMNFFQGGLTAYNIGQKCRYFRIDPIHAMHCHCVSEKIARQLSTGICELFNSDWGLGITGFASPVPESYNQLFACYAISYNHTVVDAGTLYSEQQSPLEVQLFYTNTLLHKLELLCRQDNGFARVNRLPGHPEGPSSDRLV